MRRVDISEVCFSNKIASKLNFSFIKPHTSFTLSEPSLLSSRIPRQILKKIWFANISCQIVLFYFFPYSF